jgi:hypothetical protein
LLNANIMNGGTDKSAELVTVLSNSNNEVLVTVRSNPFVLKNGMNTGYTSRTVKTVEYGSGNQASYIKSSRLLPGGVFKLCVTVIAPQSSESLDDFCDEIESEFSQYLYLVNPPDKDTIDTKFPLLMWNHSEPFSLLAQGEYYRMVVSEIQQEQTAEEALLVNSPVMFKNYLNSHELQYPYDAKELQPGKRYAWQVQKMANGVVVNKSEGWEFTVKAKSSVTENKYATLKRKLDAGFYTVEGNSLFFKLDEQTSEGKFTCYILDAKNNKINVEAHTIDGRINYKTMGYNRFEVKIQEMGLNSGYYTLVVLPGKNEELKLKFFVKE